jgi:hypothetical protein
MSPVADDGARLDLMIKDSWGSLTAARPLMI